MTKELLKNHLIVIYDGACGFCNSSIRFILKQNPSKNLKFVAYQSELGTQIRQTLKINEGMESIIVVDKDSYSIKSNAIFRIMDHVNSKWKHLRYFRIIPSFISDFIYSIIANNRYRIQKNECPIPTAEERSFFI
ncbi:MAG: DCC1-like thiol-disulfide oxidoreductase family protein [Bacteroidota bacterium]